MQSFKKILCSLFIIILILKVYSTFSNDEYKNIIRSDGRGYYAYLPAFFIYGDPSFTTSHEIEKKYTPYANDYWYINKTKDGHYYNKYFPGIAILQLPFFILAIIFSYLFHLPIDGYSPPFIISFLIGSYFYGIFGIILFKRFISKWIGKEKSWFPLLVVLSTPLIFYLLNYSSFSHLYSFFLFGLLANLVLKIKVSAKSNYYLLFGILIGLIFLTRPTNILILLIIPFILENFSSLKNTFSNFVKIKNLILMSAGFSSLIVLLIMLWKAQTGSFIIWSYNGETFDFLKPKILQHLFSWRIGLFIHIPLLILSIVGLIQKKDKYSTLTWLLYFLPLVYIYSSWWCWDYASGFGPRVYAEHLFFISLPILYLFQKPKIITYVFTCLFLIISLIRYYEFEFQILQDQRFTKENYFPSLLFWKKENKGRWNNTRYCHPAGKVINTFYLTYSSELYDINSTDEFFNTVQQKLKKPRTNERYFIKVELERYTNEKEFNDVLLVIDAGNNKGDKRFYHTIPVYNDKLKKDSWEKMIIEADLMDVFQEYDLVTIYFWNQGHKKFKLKNLRIIVEEYKV